MRMVAYDIKRTNVNLSMIFSLMGYLCSKQKNDDYEKLDVFFKRCDFGVNNSSAFRGANL